MFSDTIPNRIRPRANLSARQAICRATITSHCCEALRQEKREFFEKYSPAARQVLSDVLEKYIEYGTAQFEIPDILKVPPISERGTVPEIAALFGGAGHLRSAIDEMQSLLYAA